MLGVIVAKCKRCGGAMVEDSDPDLLYCRRLFCTSCGRDKFLETEPPPETPPAPAPPLPELPRQRYTGRPPVRERDALICRAVEDGIDPDKVAEWYGLRRRRVLQICSARRKEAERVADVLENGKVSNFEETEPAPEPAPAGGKQLGFGWWD